MPKTTTLVPLTHPATGEPVPAGAEIMLNDEEYADMRADGKVEASAAEAKAGQQEASPEGVYNARTAREEAPAAAEEPSKKKG